MIRKISALLVLLVMLGSCATRDSIRYYEGIAAAVENDSVTYNPILKQDDMLSIIVSSPNAEATANFNIASYGVGTSGYAPGSSMAAPAYLSYLVDNEGKINFPVLGSLKVGGLTRKEAISLLNTKLKTYINDPFVTLRILNYKVTVQGEVKSPGSFPVATERVTLPEALSMAGDLTIYGRRDNVLIIREIDGKKSYNFVDLTKADFINSPFYYLSQNDIVYVEPNKTRVNASVIGSDVALLFTSISLLLSIYTIYTRR